MERFDDEGCQRLANGIIILAAKDYRAALKLKRKNPGSKKAAAQIAEIESFFGSDWYRTLTEVPADIILEGLRKEAEEP